MSRTLDEKMERLRALNEHLARANGYSSSLPVQDVVTMFRMVEAVTKLPALIIRDGTVLWINERAEQLFGWREEAVVGRPAWYLVPAEERADVRHHVRESEPVSYRTQVNGRSGPEPVSVSAERVGPFRFTVLEPMGQIGHV